MLEMPIGRPHRGMRRATSRPARAKRASHPWGQLQAIAARNIPPTARGAVPRRLALFPGNSQFPPRRAHRCTDRFFRRNKPCGEAYHAWCEHVAVWQHERVRKNNKSLPVARVATMTQESASVCSVCFDAAVQCACAKVGFLCRRKLDNPRGRRRFPLTLAFGELR